MILMTQKATVKPWLHVKQNIRNNVVKCFSVCFILHVTTSKNERNTNIKHNIKIISTKGTIDPEGAPLAYLL